MIQYNAVLILTLGLTSCLNLTCGINTIKLNFLICNLGIVPPGSPCEDSQFLAHGKHSVQINLFIYFIISPLNRICMCAYMYMFMCISG